MIKDRAKCKSITKRERTFSTCAWHILLQETKSVVYYSGSDKAINWKNNNDSLR